MNKRFWTVFILTIEVCVLYYMLINYLPQFVLTIMRIAFVSLQLYGMYLFFKLLESRKKKIACGIILAVTAVVLISGNMYLNKYNYVINESYDPWNNIYLSLDNDKYAETANLDSKDDQISDFRSLNSKLYEKYGREGFYIEDKIVRGDYSYYLVSQDNNYEILKVNDAGDIVDRKEYLDNDYFGYMRLIESDTEEVYFYRSSCKAKYYKDEEESCTYTVSTFDESLDVSNEFNTELENRSSMVIYDNNIYVTNYSGGKMLKFNMYGELITENNFSNIDGTLINCYESTYGIFVSDEQIYVYQKISVVSNEEDYNGNQQHVSYNKILLYDLDLNYKENIMFDGVDVEDEMSFDGPPLTYSGRTTDLPGGKISIKNNNGNYFFDTPFFSVDLLETNENIYINIKNVETIVTTSGSGEIRTNIMVTNFFLLSLPMYLIYWYVYLTTRKSKGTKSI